MDATGFDNEFGDDIVSTGAFWGLVGSLCVGVALWSIAVVVVF